MKNLKVEVLGCRLPRPRVSSAAAWHGGKAIVAGGCVGPRWSNDGFLDDIVIVDPGSRKVTESSERLPTPRCSMAAASDGKSVYLLGGSDRTKILADIVAYDPKANSVRTPSTKLPSPRTNAAAAWSNDTAYVFGGFDGGKVLDEILTFDTKKESLSTAGARLPFPLMGAAAACGGGKVYVVGGFDGRAWSDAIVEFDPEGKRCRPLSLRLPATPHVGAAFYECAAVLAGEHLVVLGGYPLDPRRGFSPVIPRPAALDCRRSEIVIVDLHSSKVLDGPTLPSDRFGASAACGADGVFLFGGCDDALLDEVVRLPVIGFFVRMVAAALEDEAFSKMGGPKIVEWVKGSLTEQTATEVLAACEKHGISLGSFRSEIERLPKDGKKQLAGDLESLRVRGSH